MQNKIIFILILSTALLLAGCSFSQYSRETLDAFANCLADKNAKEYGAFWCPNCAKQEKMFGKSHAILKARGVYIECDPRCDTTPDTLPQACRGIKGQPSLCLEKKVNKYPTWEFADGEILVGVQEFQKLAEKSGCAFNA